MFSSTTLDVLKPLQVGVRVGKLDVPHVAEISPRGDALRAKPVSHLLGVASGQGVHDAGSRQPASESYTLRRHFDTRDHIETGLLFEAGPRYALRTGILLTL